MNTVIDEKEFCPICHGYGGHWEGCRAPNVPLCRNCDGRGWYWSNEEVTHQLGTDKMPVQTECSVCEGTGTRDEGELVIAPECAKGCQQAADYGIVGSCIPTCVYLQRVQNTKGDGR